jgi:imidazoleglycerol-phosphate dehydratase
MTERSATVSRDTLETQISVSVSLDGSGRADFDTGLPFLEHMLDQIARHGMLDLSITAKGDLHIDNLRGENTHHQIETVFKAFGRALRMALAADAAMAGITPSTKGVL